MAPANYFLIAILHIRIPLINAMFGMVLALNAFGQVLPAYMTSASFRPAVLYDSGGGAFAVAVADVNGDNSPDLLVANYNSCSVGVLLGNGDGTFKPVKNYPIGGTANSLSIALGDLNGDGHPDVALTDTGSSIHVMLGVGDGTFQTPLSFSAEAANPYQIVIRDVNADGKPDLVVADEFMVSVLIGNGNGTFQVAATYDIGGFYFGHSVAVIDVNHDLKLDLVVTTENGVSVLLGRGDGTFLAPSSFSTGGDAFWVVAGDFNRDGTPDVVVTNTGMDTVAVLLGKGDGTFAEPATYPSGGNGPWGIAVWDANSDGKQDVVVTNAYSWTVSVLLGNGDGTLQSPVSFSSVGPGLSVITTDVNGDAKPDFLVAEIQFGASQNNGGVALFLGAGGWRGATTTSLTSSSNPAAPNQMVTYTVRVKGTRAAQPTGSVVLKDRTIPVAIVPVVDNSATWSNVYSDTKLHSITAEYGGDANYGVSSSPPLLETISPLPVWSRTQVATSLSPSFVGQFVTFTASVTWGQGTVQDGGSLSFYDGVNLLGSAALKNGKATFGTRTLSGATHFISAKYLGSALFKASSGGVTQIVSRYPTHTTLTSTPNPSTSRQAITIQAFVQGEGTHPLTGTVVFFDGTSVIGSAILRDGTATLVKSALSVGTHSIAAKYWGDAFNAKSMSSSTVQVVK